jgi:hypothetical protein
MAKTLPRRRERAFLLAAAQVVGVVGGFILLGAAADGIPRTSQVPAQIPWLVSAGFTAVGLVGTGLAVLGAYEERRHQEARQARAQDLADHLVMMNVRVERAVLHDRFVSRDPG